LHCQREWTRQSLDCISWRFSKNRLWTVHIALVLIPRRAGWGCPLLRGKPDSTWYS
jgi:hypothetical protein